VHFQEKLKWNYSWSFEDLENKDFKMQQKRKREKNLVYLKKQMIPATDVTTCQTFR